MDFETFNHAHRQVTERIQQINLKKSSDPNDYADLYILAAVVGLTIEKLHDLGNYMPEPICAISVIWEYETKSLYPYYIYPSDQLKP